MKSQSCKSKGRRLQQQIAALLVERFPELEPDDIRSTSMGCPGEDLLLSPRARAQLPYAFEMKNQERLNLWASIQQCDANAGPHVPVLIVKRNRVAPRVVLPLAHFLDLIAREPCAASRAEPSAQLADADGERSPRARLRRAQADLQVIAGVLGDPMSGAPCSNLE